MKMNEDRFFRYDLYRVMLPGLVTLGLILGAGEFACAQKPNSEWVQSSSPLIGGGRVTTTLNTNSNRSAVTNVQPGSVGSLSLQRPQLTNTPVGSAAIARPTPGFVSSNTGTYGNTGFQPIAAANGTYLMPVVSYVPMNANNVARFQSPGGVQPAQFSQTAVPRYTNPSGFANQQPVLRGTSGVYGPVNPARTGFYANPPQAVASGPRGRGYRSLISRPLPAGTYVGQGWLGQPKAYVSNQPLRNMFRYLIIP